MNIDKQLFNLLVSSELAKYPDERLYNAAKLLTPEERPTVPVRLDDREWKWAKANAWVKHPERDQVYVSSKSPVYQKGLLPQIAGWLAHEAVHIQGDQEESAAYAREAEVLRRIDPEGSKSRISGIAKIVRAMNHKKERP